MKNIVIAGGGPAGFMAAISAAEEAGDRAHVEVWDADLALKTLLRTGGGRCNLANSVEAPQELAASYPRGGKFLLSIFSRFSARDAMEWFTTRGLPLAEEDGGRVFPASHRADDVRSMLKAQARAAGVRVRERFPAVSVSRNGDCFLLRTRDGAQTADALVLATGGNWKGENDAAGYGMARSLGHSITRLAPALSGLVAREKWPGRLAGLTLRGARIIAKFKDRKAADERGDVLFTHTGISGPLAFRISSRTAFLPFSQAEPLCLCLMPHPDEGVEDAERRFNERIEGHPRQGVIAALRGLLPGALPEAVAGIACVDPATQCAQLKREDRRTLVRLLCAIPLTAVERKSDGEIVTAGGVDLDGVDPATMGSKIAPGLFFCGEVLDIDGFTGGFNLQAAWSTGRVAGLGAARHVMESSAGECPEVVD